MSDQSGVIEFGRYALQLRRRELLADGQVVELGRRAYEVLLALVEARGAVLTKDELMARVWPGRIVEENNLQAQISMLRRALGEDRDLVRTIPGRGYHFAGELQFAEPLLPEAPRHNLPASRGELFGRDRMIKESAAELLRHRFLSLVGSGGIGKTCLALEVARSLLARMADGVWMVELAPVADPELVPATAASALRLKLPGGPITAERVASALGGRSVLLLLDNCEHLIDASAALAEAVRRASPESLVLATSREPLGAEGEQVAPVPPLEVPAAEGESAEAVLRTGAVQLFSARVRALVPRFAPELHALAIGHVCRQLDGIPLAIELAAARAATLGVEEVAARLHDRFGLLTGGRRTALARHRTLRATLDWSYDLLSATERTILQRLSVFVGSFTLESVEALASGAGIGSQEAVETLSSLVAKSLLAAKLDDGRSRYRLLETTRVYAQEKLVDSGEAECVARAHAEHYCALIRCAEAEWGRSDVASWVARYGYALDDVRAALDWCHSVQGDRAVGVALTIHALPLWIQQSLMDECRRRVEQALERMSDDQRDGESAMHLYAALGGALLYTGGSRRMVEVWGRALEIATRLRQVEYQVRATWGLWLSFMTGGSHAPALQNAERLIRVASREGEPMDALIGERLKGVSLHCLGDQAGARRHIENLIRAGPLAFHEPRMIRYQYDQYVAAHSFLASVLWVQGFPEQATAAANAAIERSRLLNHTLTLCHGLVQGGCAVPLLVGDLDTARQRVTLLNERSAQNSLDVLGGLGQCFSGMLQVRLGDWLRGVNLLRAGSEQLARLDFFLYRSMFESVRAWGLACAGCLDDAAAVADAELQRAARGDERWAQPELLRIRGEISALSGEPARAEREYGESLELARQQGAMSWELRTMISRTRLLRAQQRDEGVLEQLERVYYKFSEGYASADLAAARAVLANGRQAG